MPARPLSRQQFDSTFRAAVRDAIRTEALLDSIVPNTVPISGVRRGSFRKELSDSDITVAVGDFYEISQTLTASIQCTGRPVLLECSLPAVEADSSGSLGISFTMDGINVTGGTAGVFATVLDGFTGANISWEVEPDPGVHRFAVVANASVGTGTIYNGSGYTIQFRGREV